MGRVSSHGISVLCGGAWSLGLGVVRGPGDQRRGKLKRQRDGICGGACGGVILGRRFSWLGLGSGVFCLTEVFGVSD